MLRRSQIEALQVWFYSPEKRTEVRKRFAILCESKIVLRRGARKVKKVLVVFVSLSILDPFVDFVMQAPFVIEYGKTKTSVE